MVFPMAVLPDRQVERRSVARQLRTAVILENDLGRLSALFGDLLAEQGAAGHFCVRRIDDGIIPLFGDAPRLVGDGDACVVPADHVPEGACEMLLAPEVAALAPEPRAMLRGYATLVASRGALLAMKERTTATNCPLSLEQRMILARLLCGAPEIDIAAGLKMPVALILELVRDAVDALGARDRTEAIAAAARQGWLAIPVNTFHTLSRGE